MIAPIMIACGERYAKLAEISVQSFLKHHKVMLYVVADEIAEKVLSKIQSKNLFIVSLGKYKEEAVKAVGSPDFCVFQMDEEGVHDRIYSSLKPLIMDSVINDVAPESKYILALDVDTLFSGNILDKVVLELNRVQHKYDLYMVRREDPRMHSIGHDRPGSGFTLWKRSGRFVELFREGFRESFTGRWGGSQELTHQLRKKIPSMLFEDPLLHFVSPDQKNPKMTDKEILELKPAYIHLHGENSYERLLRFKKIFEKNEAS